MTTKLKPKLIDYYHEDEKNLLLPEDVDRLVMQGRWMGTYTPPAEYMPTPSISTPKGCKMQSINDRLKKFPPEVQKRIKRDAATLLAKKLQNLSTKKP